VERIGPGALLAGRYRLVDRVHADPVAALWRAQDVTLDRPAAVRVLTQGHSHVDATLDAARRAAIVDDTRLQRVVGVGVEAGCGYVILEWIEGPGAAELAGRVGEAEARRIVREAAEAIETARARGLRHGRLTPGHVRRTADGRIRVLGLAVDAATIGRPYLAGDDTTDPADLVAILYALVTGHHPTGFVDGLLGAPSSGGRPVSVRELRPDASADLDDLCLRTFAGTPPATAGEIAALLGEPAVTSGHPGDGPVVAVVGDPLPGTATPAVAAPDVASSDAVDLPPEIVPRDVAPAAAPGTPVEAGAAAAPSSRRVTVPAPTAPPDGGVTHIDLRPYDEDAVMTADRSSADALTAVRQGSRRATEALRGTLAGSAAGTRRGDGAAAVTPPGGGERLDRRRRHPDARASDDDWSILPLPVDGPEDPGWDPARDDWAAEDEFVTTGSPPVDDRWSRHDPGEPPVAAVAGGAVLDDHATAGTRGDRMGMPPPGATAVPGPAGAGRGPGRRPLVAAGVVAALVVAVGVGAVWGLSTVGDDAEPVSEATEATEAAPSADASTTPAPSPSPAEPVPPPTPVGVQPLDPEGDNAENDADAPRAIDGDPATAWRTAAYNTQDFGNLKSGVGLVVNLGDVVATTGLTITAPGDGGTFEIRAASQPLFDGSTVIATGTTSSAGPVPLTWDAVETQYLIVWFTALPQNDGQWRGLISEIALS
jgi:hypothetical protein